MPFIGDLVGVLLSSYILGEAARLGASASVLARMAFNIAIEGVVGLVPVAGDVFDAAWKANQRNVRLLNEWLERPARAERSSRLLVFALGASVLALVVASLLLTYLLLHWLVDPAT